MRIRIRFYMEKFYFTFLHFYTGKKLFLLYHKLRYMFRDCGIAKRSLTEA